MKIRHEALQAVGGSTVRLVKKAALARELALSESERAQQLQESGDLSVAEAERAQAERAERDQEVATVRAHLDSTRAGVRVGSILAEGDMQLAAEFGPQALQDLLGSIYIAHDGPKLAPGGEQRLDSVPTHKSGRAGNQSFAHHKGIIASALSAVKP